MYKKCEVVDNTLRKKQKRQKYKIDDLHKKLCFEYFTLIFHYHLHKYDISDHITYDSQQIYNRNILKSAIVSIAN